MNAPLNEQFLTLQEIYLAAKRNLAPGPWAYLMGGAETETTVLRNRRALDEIAFRPRVLRDVSRIESTATFLGNRVRLPVMLAPIGGLESIVEGGAAAAARAAAQFGVPQMLSSVCQPGLEETAAAPQRTPRLPSIMASRPSMSRTTAAGSSTMGWAARQFCPKCCRRWTAKPKS